MKRLIGSSVVVVIVAACGGSTAPPTGTGTGTDAGTPPVDSGIARTTDSGGGGTDSGVVVMSTDAGLPAAVMLQFQNCPAFAACGGDPTGTWDYTAACIDSTAIDALSSQCAGAEKPTLNSATGSVQGRITFTATQVSRQVVSTTNVDVTLPLSCFTGSQIPITTCANAQTALGLQNPGATCVDGADAQHCDCKLTFSSSQAGTNGYTIAASMTELDIDDGSTYDFCITGNKIQHQQTKPANGAGQEPGLLEATKE